MIADRLSEAAQAIRSQFVRYNCSTGTKDTWRCNAGTMAVTFFDQIDLCQAFWNAPKEQAETILHEWIHYTSLLTIWDRTLGGIETAGCYQHLAALIATGTIQSPDPSCESSADPLPARDPARIAADCPRNWLVTPSVVLGGHGSSAAAGRGLYGSLGADLALPLTPLHRFDLDVGARASLLGNVGPEHQSAYLLGVRAGLSARWRPWRSHVGLGAFVEGGAAVLPGSADPAGGTTGRTTRPYYGYGLRGTLDLRLDRQRALEIFAEVSQTTVLDVPNEKLDAFSYGFGVGYRF